MSVLNRHPFAVDAFFRSSLVLGYAAPIELVRGLLPPGLEADSFDNIHGYLAAAFVDARALRAAGFPAFLGQSFRLIGYRVFVRLRTAAGKRLRGLYILRSETDSRRMELLGNIFTSYRYERTGIHFTQDADRISISGGTGLEIAASLAPDPPLPEATPFRDWNEARRFAGPMPFTFSTIPSSSDFTLVEGVREHWNPAPLRVERAIVPYFDELLGGKAILANAFLLRDIPYHWKKGRRIACENGAGSRD